MHHLPPELIRMVIEYSNDLPLLASLNKYYNQIVTPILYETVALRGERPIQAFSRTLLTGHPMCRVHVKTIQILHVSPTVPDDSSFGPVIKDLLMNTPKLIDLTLILSWNLYQYLFEQPGFPFVLRRFCVESIPELENYLIAFLEKQTQIESIRVLGGVGSLGLVGYRTGAVSALESNLLPNLEEIEAMPITVVNLVQKRPISRIYVTHDSNRWVNANGVLDAIKQSSMPLAHLSLTLEPELWRACWETEIIRIIEALGPNRESLRELTLRIALTHSSLVYASMILLLESNTSPSHGFENLRNHLSTFSNLRKLRLECSTTLLRGRWDYSIPPGYCDAVLELSQFEPWKESCHSLEEVEMFGVSLKR